MSSICQCLLYFPSVIFVFRYGKMLTLPGLAVAEEGDNKGPVNQGAPSGNSVS
jgi:hypothetical protein